MKWNAQSGKLKSTVVIGGTLVILLITFLSPIKRTLEAQQSCEALRKKILDARNAPTAISRLEKQMSQWSKAVITDLSTETLQLKLFEVVGKAAGKQRVAVMSLKSIGIKDDLDYRLQTFEVEMIGSFKSLLLVLDELEKTLKYGKVASVQFVKRKKKGTKHEALFIKILIQSVTKHAETTH